MARKAVVMRSIALDVELDQRLNAHLEAKRLAFSRFVRDLITAELDKETDKGQQ